MIDERRSYCAGGVVVNDQGKIIVVSQHGNSWSLPKGHINNGETARAAAEREIREETGVIKLSFVKPLGSYERFRIGLDSPNDVTELKHIELFLYTTNESELNPEDPENPEARWVAPDEVADLLTHSKDSDFFIQVLPDVKEVIAKTA